MSPGDLDATGGGKSVGDAPTTKPSDASPPAASANVADRLAEIARLLPDHVAVATPGGPDLAGKNAYATCTFRQLDTDAEALARGLVELGVRPGHRLILLVRPGIAFVKLVFALLRSGATAVLIDPGMPRDRLIDCLVGIEPDGFVAVSMVQAVRLLFHNRFPSAHWNVTVGRRWFWGGATYRRLLNQGSFSDVELPIVTLDDAAAIIFTSGSTGPPKGVLYTHRMFSAQASEIQSHYQIGLGGADLACFPLFGLFNSVMGVTTVFPQMDFSRPAKVDPRKLIAAGNDWQVTQAFASPAVWDRLSRHCLATDQRLPTLRRVYSCGAPVPARVLENTLRCVHPDAKMFTPYGATECLPVSSIEAREVFSETSAATNQGKGVCVGRKLASIEWQVIRICDEPLPTLDNAVPLSVGEVGELIVKGPQVSPRYLSHGSVAHGAGSSLTGGRGLWERDDASNRLAKIAEGREFWHRMGDVGYLDEEGRFWYCGRKTHRVETSRGVRHSLDVEGIVDCFPGVKRSALVGVGPQEQQRLVVVLELADQGPTEAETIAALCSASQTYPVLGEVAHWLVHPSLPVDVRHNSKINREQLASWAAGRLGGDPTERTPRQP